MAKFTATAPDGTSWDVDAPDGMSSEQISAEVDAAFKSRGAGAAKPRAEEPFMQEARDIASSTPAERIAANPIVRTLTSAAEPVMGAAGLVERAMGGNSIQGSQQQLKAMQEKGRKALGFSPAAGIVQDVGGAMLSPLSGMAMKAPAAATATGRIAQGAGWGGVGGMTAPGDKPVEQGGVGAMAGGAITAGIESLMKAPGALRSIGGKVGEWLTGGGKANKRAANTGAGAEDVTNELQAQRNVMEKAKGARQGGGSEYERAATDFEQRMLPMKDAAFNSPTKVDAAQTIDMIDSLVAKNPDKRVRAALEEVRSTIENATTSAQAKNLPAAGARMTPADLKAMQGQSGSMDVQMADEVRQSINRMIEQKGDKALDAHTKDILSQLKNQFMGASTPEHRAWIAAEAEGRQALDKYKPDVSVLGRTTSDVRGMPTAAGSDAQAKLESIFSGPSAARDLKDLMARTSHDPAASTGLRDSFGKWLMPADQAGKANLSKMGGRWNDVKDAVRESQLFTPSHYDAVDKVMSDLFKAEQGASGLKSAGAGAAAVVGSLVGRPGTFAGAARTALGFLTKSEKTPEQVGRMIAKVMQDEAAATAAAAAPTAENVRALTAAVAGQQAGEQKPRKRPNVLGMRPSGI